MKILKMQQKFFIQKVVVFWIIVFEVVLFVFMMRANVIGIELVNKDREKTSILRGCFIFKSGIVIIFRKAIGT